MPRPAAAATSRIQAPVPRSETIGLPLMPDPAFEKTAWTIPWFLHGSWGQMRQVPFSSQLTRGPCRKPDEMTRAAALGGGAHRDFVDLESGRAKPFCKRRIWP